MSAHCYIQLSDVPQPLMATSRRRQETGSFFVLIAFDDCPLVGYMITDEDGTEEIAYPFPRSTIREDFVSWLMKWGFSFRVEQ